jgi:lysophospholipase L1-like esterase
MSPLWIPLLPLLAAQGLSARRRALRLAEPTGSREGIEGAGPCLNLLVLGDSAAAGVGVSNQRWALAGQLVAALSIDHRVQWRLLARTGATTASTLQALPQLVGRRYDVVLTSLGVNDLTGGLTAQRFVQLQSQLFDSLRAQHGASLLLASGMPPVHRFPALPQPLRRFLGGRAQQMDAALAALAARRGDVVHVPLEFHAELDASAMAEDGFHPGMLAYREWARRLEARIRSAPELAHLRAAAPSARAGHRA